jgi:hypothetical protein
VSTALTSFLLRSRPEHELSAREWLELYRVAPWGHKVSNVRLLLYPLLAYGIAGPGDWTLRVLNLAALQGLLMFQGALNDYWDHRVSGERNRFGLTLARLSPSPRRVAFWLAAPLAASLPIVALLGRDHKAHAAIGLLLLGALLAVAYSLPPLRLKARRGWAMLVAPWLTTCMFLEALVLEGPPRPATVALLALLFLFQLYAEAIHSVANASSHEEKCTTQTAWDLAQGLPAVHAAVGLMLAAGNPWFALSTVAGVVRLFALRRASVSRLRERGQSGLTSRVLCLYEFAAYAVLFAFGVLR